MEERRFPPRMMPFPDLINTLVSEHSLMSKGLEDLRLAVEMGDFETASTTLKEIDPIFRQHIADEEAQVLRLLIDKIGVQGAAEEVRIFQQHRPIFRLMQTIAEMTQHSPMELETQRARLQSLFVEHTGAEERRVFPKALALQEEER